MKKNFKKILTGALSAVFALTLVACGGQSASSDSGSEAKKTIKIGASPSPHAEILKVVKDELAKEGYDLDIVEFDDYIMPNTALEAGELDANYFQHITYLKNFNEEQGTHLANACDVHFEPMRIFAGKTKSLEDLKDGATVAVPNDPTNEARALLLLQQEGLIKLKDGVGTEATKLDIAENPKNLDIKELEAAQVPRALEDSDIAVVNGNYALSANLSTDLVLAAEKDDSDAAKAYVNVIAVKEDNKDSDATAALVKAVQSEAVKKFIEEKYSGSVVAMF